MGPRTNPGMCTDGARQRACKGRVAVPVLAVRAGSLPQHFGRHCGGHAERRRRPRGHARRIHCVHAQLVRRIAGLTRPIMLVSSSRSTRISRRSPTVVSQAQQGFFRGRLIDRDILGLNSAMAAFSARQLASGVGLLIDFAGLSFSLTAVFSRSDCHAFACRARLISAFALQRYLLGLRVPGGGGGEDPDDIWDSPGAPPRQARCSP